MLAFPGKAYHRKGLAIDRKVRVAIACQGGGSHTAFTAGALKRLLRDQRHEFVALSGTSGGAICAFLAWHALVQGDEGGAGERAAKLLDSFWTDNAASEPFNWLLNEWTVWINRLQGSIILPSVSPYSTPTSFWAQEQLRRTLERHVDFGRLKTPMESPAPMLLIGAVNVLSGDFKAFNSRRDTISSDTVLASTALPTLFRAVRTDGGVYWDGLFSQNPPVRELPRVNPDEIWVIQIDPQKRDEEPKSMADILDRRNELAGNISLYQEIDFIEKINHLVDKLVPGENRKEKTLRVPGGEGEKGREYRHIEVRWIELTEPLDFASKLDRNPAFIWRMMADGERSAEAFLRRLEPAPATRP
jgi:NTE family protein